MYSLRPSVLATHGLRLKVEVSVEGSTVEVSSLILFLQPQVFKPSHHDYFVVFESRDADVSHRAGGSCCDVPRVR